MTIYVEAHPIHVGQWLFYPEFMAAQNTHNGNWARFWNCGEGQWRAVCINCPSEKMLSDLVEWFGRWIQGETHRAPAR